MQAREQARSLQSRNGCTFVGKGKGHPNTVRQARRMLVPRDSLVTCMRTVI